jgi:mono/diheme cytochrome c family protein
MNIIEICLKELSKYRRYVWGLFLILFLFSSNFSTGQTAEDEKNFGQCKACHTIGGGKLVGPDLKGITERRDEAWLIKFIQNSQELIKSGDATAVKVFEENNKIPMPAHSLTDEQVKGILKYIAAGGKIKGDNTSKEEAQAAPVVKHKELEAVKEREARGKLRLTVLIMSILLIISLIDLFGTKVIKAKAIHYIIILTALTIIGEGMFVEAAALGRQQYYQPDQPIYFSHAVHAGQNQIDCEYCHYTAEESMHAGIPPTQVCMNCHHQVKSTKLTFENGTIKGTDEINKIYQHMESGEPINWIKVHNLPDHVYFNHAQHVKAAGLECEECHGPVEEMDQIIQVEDLSMGWCIECHRTKEVNFAGNKFYDKYKKLHEKLAKGEIGKVTPQMLGGDECQKCHY